MDSMTYRLKEPSLDLLCVSNSLVYLGESNKHEVFGPSQPGMIEGIIHECFIDLVSKEVSSWSLRYDKRLPNNIEVYSRVMFNYLNPKETDSMMRRLMTNVSFEFRREVHRRAAESVHAVKLLTDVGRRRFQARSVCGLKEFSYAFFDTRMD
ncbi:unnamed protein product, partial [Discosporangium mesarthrocarpum]